MKKQTKYRIVHSGWNHWLQYKGWIFWHYIPRPNYKYYVGEDRYITLDGFPVNTDDYIGGSEKQCREFAERYPDINEYFEESYNPRQKKLEERVIAEHNRREELSRKKIKLY